MTSRIKAAVIVGVLLVLVPRASADPVTPVEPPAEAEILPMPSTHLWMRSGPGTLRGPNGKDYLIPQNSHILTNERWSELDSEMLRLSEQETRLDAENKSLKKSASAWTPPAWLLVMAFGAGAASGAYMAMKF